MAAKRYTEDHEWVLLEGEDEALMGITDYAQKQLGELVFVELPEVGQEVDAGDEMAVVESVKAASEVYAPAAGAVLAVNEKLADEPGLINEAAETEGWFARLKLTDPSALDALLDEEAYKALLAGLEDA